MKNGEKKFERTHPGLPFALAFPSPGALAGPLPPFSLPIFAILLYCKLFRLTFSPFVPCFGTKDIDCSVSACNIVPFSALSPPPCRPFGWK